MALYKRESLDQVRDATDFVALVGAHTDLRRAGPSRYEGLCPFHEERTPSFGIDPQQKVYYCFGCQASGDLFTFVQEAEGLDFREAVQMLADRAGVALQLEQEDPREAQERRRKERVLALLSRACSYYQRLLSDSPQAAPAREYLAARGLREEALRAFAVGWAPSAPGRLVASSLRSGFSEAELLQSGLAQRSRESRELHDRFRERITFPLADIRGRVLGFGARTLRDGGAPKYLNSPDSDVYKKGSHLYGAHLARSHAAKSGVVILCEGYTDVIAMHQAGILNAVGLMGTALTPQQVAELSRLAPQLVLALDADSAGQEAMLKASKVAAERKIQLLVAELPAGADPAQLILEQGAESMQELVSGAIPFVRFRVQRTLEAGDLSSPEARDRVLDELRPVFAEIPQSALRLDLARLAASRLALPESLLDTLLRQDQPTAGAQRGAQAGPQRRAPSLQTGPGTARRRQRASSRQEGPAPARRQPRAHSLQDRPAPARRQRREPTSLSAATVTRQRIEVERAFLALCIALPQQGERALKRLRPEAQLTDEVLRRVASHLALNGLTEPLAGIEAGDVEVQKELARLIVQAGEGEAAEAMLAVCELQLQLAHLDRLIQAARANGEREVTALAGRRAQVQSELDRAQELALQSS